VIQAQLVPQEKQAQLEQRVILDQQELLVHKVYKATLVQQVQLETQDPQGQQGTQVQLVLQAILGQQGPKETQVQQGQLETQVLLVPQAIQGQQGPKETQVQQGQQVIQVPLVLMENLKFLLLLLHLQHREWFGTIPLMEKHTFGMMMVILSNGLNLGTML
jgi:hypothetical protein